VFPSVSISRQGPALLLWKGNFRAAVIERQMANLDRLLGTLLLDGEGEFVQTSDAVGKKKYVMYVVSSRVTKPDLAEPNALPR